MAAVENNEVQQAFDSSSGNESFELSSPMRNDFTFVCNGLDSFLKSLDSELPKGPESGLVSDACAAGADPDHPDIPGSPPLPTNHPRTSVISKPSDSSKVLLKDYDCPKPLIFFNQTIAVASNLKYTKSIEFVQEPPSNSVDCLSKCRFPPQLRSLYKGIKPPPESVPSPPKTRRRRQRNRLSLSYHAYDNDDAHGRRNLLPTDEDLRTTLDKIYHFRGIPYVFQCSGGKSRECLSKCAQQVDSFSLYMEINPKPGTPLHPLVRENIDCVTGAESCVVDELSALVAVTAVQCKKPPMNRLFVPVSFHLKDKIGCLKRIIPEVFPKTEIEEPVHGVVEDLLDFVDRQLSFNLDVKIEHDPDASAENSFLEEEISQGNVDCQDLINPEVTTVESGSSERRRKRGKCKEQNKVLRELRKLMNISVTDETEEITDNADVKCSELSCSLGCVCGSVHEKYHPPSEHCGNIGCMFECVCSEKFREMYLNLGDLSKEEKSWHQTVIRKRNNALEIKSGVDRTKRRKKMPSRYENTVTGYMMNRCLEFNLRVDKKLAEVKEYKASVLTKTPKPNSLTENPKIQLSSASKSSFKSIFDKEVAQEDEEMAKRSAAISEKIRKSLKRNYQIKVMANNERRLALTMTETASTLLDVFVWCTIHHKYDCYCMNWIILGKNNSFVCRPPSCNRFTAEKYLGSVTLEPVDADSRQVVMYDQAKHCARTAGSFIDYENRNKDPMFKKKLSYLLDNNIISFSNSFFKAKPVATFTSEIPLDNYPFSPALTRKITRGVGNVVQISSAPNEFVDVGGRLVSSRPLELPPDDWQWESSEDEIVDTSKSDILLDDDGSEFIPKPKKQRLESKPINQFCFSSVFHNKTKSSANYVDKPTSSHKNPDYDSDIELVEEPIETYSLSSSPEAMFVDGGTLSDSDSCNDFPDNEDLSMNSKCDTSNYNDSNDANQARENYSAAEDDCDSISTPGNLVTDESFNTSITPTKSSDNTPLNSLDKPLMSNQSQQPDTSVLKESCDRLLNQRLKSVKKPVSLPQATEYGKEDSLSSESDTIQPTPVEEEDEELPKLGLFCMSLPDLGYLKVKESRPGNFIMEDPHDPKALRIFKNCKEASDYMKKLVGLCINPEFACSEWVMVTRGVLEKYQSKRFGNSKMGGAQKKRKLGQEKIPQKKIDLNSDIAQSKQKKIENVALKNNKLQIAKLATSKPVIQGQLGKVLKKNFDLKVHQNNSDTAGLESDDIFQSSHKLLTGKKSTAAEEVKPLSGTVKLATPVPASQQPVAVPVVKNVVGTFPNLCEANSFIEKNFQSRLYVRPCVGATTQTTGTILTAGTTQIAGNRPTAGNFVRMASPMMGGPRVRGGVLVNKGVRTVLVRRAIAGQSGTARPILHIRPALAGLKVSGAGVQTPTITTIVSTTNAGASKTEVNTTASSPNSMKIETPVGADIGIPPVTTVFQNARESPNTSSQIVTSSIKVTTPLISLSFPIKSCPKGSTVISTASIPTTLTQGESLASQSTEQVQGVAPTLVTSSALPAAAVNQVSVNNSNSFGIPTNHVTTSVPTKASLGSTTSMKQIEIAAATPSAVLTGSVATLVATPATAVKQDERITESACAADSSPVESVSSESPFLPKHCDPPKVPGTFVIESFSTSSSSLPSASSPSTIVVRHCRPILPKPVIPKVPPRRADVIVPRSEDFATLISPAPSDTPPAPKVQTPSENKVFNGVLLPKSDKKEVKAYICHKNPTAKSNYRSLLQKR